MEEKKEIKAEDIEVENVVPKETIEAKEKEKEQKDLKDELAVITQQLNNNKMRVEGGFVRMGNKEIQVPAIGVEIEDRGDAVEMAQIEINMDAPMNPMFAYEANDRYRELKKKIKRNEMNGKQKVLDKVIAQKTQIDKENPELEKRKTEIEKELGKETK